jgi:glutaredoxin 3
VPQIFIGKAHVGGCDELYELDAAGKLDPLLTEGTA